MTSISLRLRAWVALALTMGTLLGPLSSGGAAHALQASTGGRALPASTPGAGRVVTSETPDATRAELTAALDRASRGGTRMQGEAAAIRRRLSEGDFRPGDRISLMISGDSGTRELPVREGRMVDLPAGIPPVQLAGVLRAELVGTVVAHLRKYVREPDVRVRPLTRVLVNGAVARPGVYFIPSDLPLGEAVMAAGGVTGNARADRITVSREGKRLIRDKDYARLAREGRTLEESGVRSGDEVVVAERKQRSWGQVAQNGFFALSALAAILTLVRSAYQ